MAVVYTTALKTTRMTDVLTALDIGAAAKLEIGTAAMALVLCTITLNDPSGSVTSGVLNFTVSPTPTGTAVAAGTAAEARLRTSANADVVTGLTVGTSGTNVIINNTAIQISDIINLTAASITHG